MPQTTSTDRWHMGIWSWDSRHVRDDEAHPRETRRPWAPAYGSLASRTEARAHADRRGSRTNQDPLGGGKRTPTQPDTSRNRPAEAPLRPPVIDGIEELD